MIRESFPLAAGRIDLSRLQGAGRDSRVLAAQTNRILDSVDGFTPGCSQRERTGNHLVVDRLSAQGLRHEEVWFTPALPLSVAEYPEEAQDRTCEVAYLIVPEPSQGLVHVEKSVTKSLGEPTHPDWNLA